MCKARNTNPEMVKKMALAKRLTWEKKKVDKANRWIQDFGYTIPENMERESA